MTEWLNRLRYDPLPFLLGSKCVPVVYFTRRDLLGENPGRVQTLWADVQAQRIVAKQKSDGRWEYPGGGNRRIRSTGDYDQIETYRQLGLLVEEFGLDRTHPAIGRAAQFLFGHQTEEGDFRGIYGRQYSPNYTAGIMELLVKAGFGEDRRIKGGFGWLLSIRQGDGGWAIPMRTVAAATHRKWTDALQSKTILPDTSKPFSHLVTGVVLRAFAAHNRYRKSREAHAAGELVSRRIFRADSYIDRKAPEFWERVSFPFWFTDVVSILDSLSLLGFRAENQAIQNALRWLIDRQLDDGSFKLKLLRDRDRNLKYWVCLAICRVLKRF
jgi:hypothetical protein